MHRKKLYAQLQFVFSEFLSSGQFVTSFPRIVLFVFMISHNESGKILLDVGGIDMSGAGGRIKLAKQLNFEFMRLQIHDVALEQL